MYSQQLDSNENTKRHRGGRAVLATIILMNNDFRLFQRSFFVEKETFKETRDFVAGVENE